MEIKKWIKIFNWRARNVRNATTPMTTTTTTATTKRANRNRNYTKSNSEFEIQINFCLRVLNLTFSICFMQMMQFFLFRCCCYYYWCCCCTFVVVLFVFSIPLAFAGRGEVEAADTTCLVKVRCLTEDHLAFGNNLSQAHATERRCQKLKMREALLWVATSQRWAGNMLLATWHQQHAECWVLSVPSEEKAKRAPTAQREREKELLKWKRKCCRNMRKCCASNMEHFSNATRLLLWRSLSNQKWLSKCDAIFVGDFDSAPESRNFLKLAYSEACCAVIRT